MNVASWPFAPLRPYSYDVIMADPPWKYRHRSARGIAKSSQTKYRVMTLAEIVALPVRHLAAEDCWLWLWTTSPMLPQGLQIMDAWGFRYVTQGEWSKRGATSLAMGTGHVLRCAGEPFLIGKIGAPPVCSHSVRNVIEERRREHSRKPDAAYTAAEKLFGPARRADLFSRESRPGWDGWGDEAGKFDAAECTT